MSHLKERKEKICLNCNAATYGRFCHICGQENIETKESFWHLAFHFIADIFHYDGKFFRTIRYLIFRPGFLTAEYIAGRRTSFLHPIRLYVFTSAVFFLIYFSFFYKNSDLVKFNDVNDEEEVQTASYYNKRLQYFNSELKKAYRDTAFKLQQQSILEAINLIKKDSSLLAKDSNYKVKIDTLKYIMTSINSTVSFQKTYTNKKQYDSIQNSLPKNQKDGLFERYYAYKKIELNETGLQVNSKEFFTKIADYLVHKFPQMLFVYLPLFSLSLQLLYFRNKRYFYVNHIVFSLHLFCGLFIIMLAGLIVDTLLMKFKFEDTRIWFTILALFFWYKSFRNFYKQSRIKLISKQILLYFINLIFAFIIFIIFIVIAALNIH
ncbi:MAG: DUF3667 domain-containing protein [Chitinophagaceae bacterium]